MNRIVSGFITFITSLPACADIIIPPKGHTLQHNQGAIISLICLVVLLTINSGIFLYFKRKNK